MIYRGVQSRGEQTGGGGMANRRKVSWCRKFCRQIISWPSTVSTGTSGPSLPGYYYTGIEWYRWFYICLFLNNLSRYDISNHHGPCSLTMGLFVNCMLKAYGTAKSGVGIASMGVMRPDMIMSLALTTSTRFSTKIVADPTLAHQYFFSVRWFSCQTTSLYLFHSHLKRLANTSSARLTCFNTDMVPTFYGTEKPRKSIIPVVMAGVLGIYGLITAVIINGTLAGKPCKIMAFCDVETALV